MRQIPEGGFIGKTIHKIRMIQSLRIPLHAANACYFLVLAVFPALILLLELLRCTPLEVERLGEMLQGILPEAFHAGAEELILLTYDNTSSAVLGLSAVTALWSASRGIYGVLTGLNAVYGVSEDRGWLHTRLISVGYMLAFLVILVLTLGLHVFGTELLTLLEGLDSFGAWLLTECLDLRFWLLAALQTGYFTAMFMFLPNRRNRFWDSLPGAALASCGWLMFSRAYSVYVEQYARLTNVYGSVYAVALSMLWLYCCMVILFYGGALNAVLSGKKRP